jgi:hypothetical protein
MAIINYNISTSLAENRQAPGHGNMSGPFFAHFLKPK